MRIRRLRAAARSARCVALRSINKFKCRTAAKHGGVGIYSIYYICHSDHLTNPPDVSTCSLTLSTSASLERAPLGCGCAAGVAARNRVIYGILPTLVSTMASDALWCPLGVVYLFFFSRGNVSHSEYFLDRKSHWSAILFSFHRGACIRQVAALHTSFFPSSSPSSSIGSQ